MIGGEQTNASRSARTRFALTTLIQSIEEGDEKITKLQNENGGLEHELQVARADLANMRRAFSTAHEDVGTLRLQVATMRAELASADKAREKIVAVVSRYQCWV